MSVHYLHDCIIRASARALGHLIKPQVFLMNNSDTYNTLHPLTTKIGHNKSFTYLVSHVSHAAPSFSQSKQLYLIAARSNMPSHPTPDTSADRQHYGAIWRVRYRHKSHSQSVKALIVQLKLRMTEFYEFLFYIYSSHRIIAPVIFSSLQIPSYFIYSSYTRSHAPLFPSLLHSDHYPLSWHILLLMHH